MKGHSTTKMVDSIPPYRAVREQEALGQRDRDRFEAHVPP